MYYRGDQVYNTKWFSTSNFVYYVLMNFLGHMYVCTSNLNYFKGAFRSRYTTNSEILKTIAISPLFYFISSVMVLRSQRDLSESPCLLENSVEEVCEGQFWLW